MTSKAPPIPPDQRAHPEVKGGDKPDIKGSSGHSQGNAGMNLKEQGQAGNINQNTHHQGYQQDR